MTHILDNQTSSYKSTQAGIFAGKACFVGSCLPIKGERVQGNNLKILGAIFVKEHCKQPRHQSPLLSMAHLT